MEITQSQFEAMKKVFDKAEDDTTPYLAVANDEVNIVGDPDKTERKKGTYTLLFGYPNTPYWKKQLEGEEIVSETENYIGIKKTYEDVWVPPRVQTSVTTAFVELYRFFVMATEDGSLRDLTPDETIEVLRILNQDMIDAMCHVVATVLGLDTRVENFMLPMATATAMMEMAQDFPELINGADFFIEDSFERK